MRCGPPGTPTPRAPQRRPRPRPPPSARTRHSRNCADPGPYRNVHSGTLCSNGIMIPVPGGPHMDSARRPHHQVTFGILALGIGAFSLLQSLVIPLLSTVQAELHTSQSAVTWVLTAYLLSASVMTPILGRGGDIYGKKWLFVAALAALAVGSVLAAVAPNLAVMIVARVIQGVGGGSLPLGFGIIRDEFPAGRGAGAVGILVARAAGGVRP